MTPNKNRSILLERPMSGRELRELRETLGWTQERMAEALEVSRRTLQSREKSERVPEPEAVFVKALAERELERLRFMLDGGGSEEQEPSSED